MIESSEDEEEAEEDVVDDEEADEDIPGAFAADLEPSELAFVASLGPEPHSYRQALMRPDAAQWTKAAEEEIEAHSQNGTWELADLPAGRRAIGSRWVFKVKRTADGSIERYKARLVAKGFSQRPGFDFNETFAPTARFSAIRTILALSALEDLHLQSIDISHAFINGDLEEEVFMEQPEGFEQGEPGQVLRLKRSLYGLKQASRMWYQKLQTVLIDIGFHCVEVDSSIYVFTRESVRIIMPVFVDDITLASNSLDAIQSVVKELQSHFRLRDLGPTSYLLGIHITRDRPNRTLSLSQCQYILDVLERFSMSDCKPVLTPMEPGLRLSSSMSPNSPQEVLAMKGVPYVSAVGALLYLATATRPDIAYTVSTLCRFNSNPGMEHWKAVKHLMRYIKGTVDMKLTYSPSPSRSDEPFVSYTDADHGGDSDTARSTSGYLLCIGTGAVSWSSKLQSIVALSTTEAEFVAAVEAGKEMVWMRHLLGELGYKVKQPSVFRIDNQSALTVAKNPEHHGRMKHLDMRYFWLRRAVSKGILTPVYVATEEQAADALTKALRPQLLHKCCSLMGLVR